MKRCVAIWCCAWVGILQGIIEVLCLGLVLSRLEVKAVKFFAFKHWF